MLHPQVKVWVLAFARIPLRLSAMWVLGAWIAFQVYNYVTTDSNEVSWAAHVGGVLAGIVLVPLFKRRDVALFDRDLSRTSKTAEPKEVENPQRWGR